MQSFSELEKLFMSKKDNANFEKNYSECCMLYSNITNDLFCNKEYLIFLPRQGLFATWSLLIYYIQLLSFSCCGEYQQKPITLSIIYRQRNTSRLSRCALARN